MLANSGSRGGVFTFLASMPAGVAAVSRVVVPLPGPRTTATTSTMIDTRRQSALNDVPHFFTWYRHTSRGDPFVGGDGGATAGKGIAGDFLGDFLGDPFGDDSGMNPFVGGDGGATAGTGAAGSDFLGDFPGVLGGGAAAPAFLPASLALLPGLESIATPLLLDALRSPFAFLLGKPTGQNLSNQRTTLRNSCPPPP